LTLGPIFFRILLCEGQLRKVYQEWFVFPFFFPPPPKKFCCCSEGFPRSIVPPFSDFLAFLVKFTNLALSLQSREEETDPSFFFAPLQKSLLRETFFLDSVLSLLLQDFVPGGGNRECSLHSDPLDAHLKACFILRPFPDMFSFFRFYCASNPLSPAVATVFFLQVLKAT